MKNLKNFSESLRACMLLLFALANFPLAFAQNEPCGFDAALQMMLQRDPGYQNRIESFEENYEQNFEYQGGGIMKFRLWCI
ncbi:MAG: hypothetical protein J5I98_01440 [Phaeodactylibacter sp.]|nr:hypothetical protein [Phaeodactylibacter sp.]